MGNGARDQAAEQGYALLVAATPPGRHPLLEATEALPALAATPPAVLLGTATGSVVQLADPGDPNTVLSHLRTAAAHDGPLLVYLAGQLLLDSRQKLPHLALTRSTPRSVRYTGLPWHWLAAEFAHRPPGRTAVFADLIADEDLWRDRARQPLGNGLALYGTLAPPPDRRRTASPGYSRALAALLRASSVRPPLDELHQRAAQDAWEARDPEQGGEPPLLFGGQPVQAPLPTVPVPPAPYPASAPYPAPAAYAGPATSAGATMATAPVAPGAAPGMPPLPPEAPPYVSPDAPPDPHEAVYQAAREGRHSEAVTIAAAWETAALRSSGPSSEEAIHWVEVRADLAHQADDAARACTLWLQAAAIRLQSGQNPEAAEVFGAVDRAHHCWHQVTDAAVARELGGQLAELREWAPGRRPGAVQDVRSRLASLGAGGTRQTAG